jgi:putative redox protein
MADTPAPTVTLELDWLGELRFAGRSGATTLTLDADATAGPTPVQALAYGLAGCMAADVVHVVRKGRHPLVKLRARLHAERAAQAPKRLTRVQLHFEVVGAVPAAVVERAIQLSRDTYCSVWHSLRADIVFETSFEVLPE